MNELTYTIGKSEKRKEAFDKVTGAAQYVADIRLDLVYHGAIVRSKHHFARILNIKINRALKAPGVLKVLTFKDIPGSKIYGLMVQDQTPLAIDTVRHLGDPIALVIAENENQARVAADLVEIDYQVFDPIFDPEEALLPTTPKIHSKGNLVSQLNLLNGDIAKGFTESDYILEETFLLPRVSPGYLEMENSIATWNNNDSVTVWVSSQHPFIDQEVIAKILNIPINKVRVKSAIVGGAFGGKVDSSLAILAALGAWTTKSSVKLVNTRGESFLAHPKRHPARIKMKLGTKKDGTFNALDAKVIMDTGAYASLGPGVSAALTETIPGVYHIPNVRVETSLVYTNSPLSGAMRGFGSPQAYFAIESMVDILAKKIGMDSIEIRKRNILCPGDKMYTGVKINKTGYSLQKCLSEAEILFKKYSQIPSTTGKISGVGMALVAQPMGYGAKVPDDSTISLEWLPNGTILVYLGSPDLGQGLATVVEQMTAESLGLPFEQIHTFPLDTIVSPNGNVTVASRMTYMAGNAVIRASKNLIQQLLDLASELLEVPIGQLKYAEGTVILPDGEKVKATELISRLGIHSSKLKSQATYSFPYPEETTPQHLPVGIPHVIFTFGAQVIRVEVDIELGTVQVTHLAAVHDVGKIINKACVEGQIEGGIIMGLGYALYEQMACKGDEWVNSFTEYLLPTSKDIPLNYENIILEAPEVSGPFGAKGIGEIPLVPTAPAIANAVQNAIGIRVTSLPITPEKIIQ